MSVNKNYKENCINSIYSFSQQEWLQDLFDFPCILRSKKKFCNKLVNAYLKCRYLFTQKPTLKFINFVVTTKCTLNCKECCYHVPKFSNETHFKPISFSQFKSDLDQLLAITDTIHIFQFIGGEPFIVKELPEMIDYARSKKQIKNIFVTTNCTIKPNEKMLKSLKKVSVQLSDYRAVPNVKLYYDEIKQLFIKNKIKFSAFQEKSNESTWTTMPELFLDENIETQKLKNLYQSCWHKNCSVVCDGKLYLCPTHMFLDRNSINIYNESIDIRNCTSSDLINFYSQDIAKTCSYCHFENTAKTVIGEQEIRR